MSATGRNLEAECYDLEPPNLEPGEWPIPMLPKPDGLYTDRCMAFPKCQGHTPPGYIAVLSDVVICRYDCPECGTAWTRNYKYSHAATVKVVTG